MVSIYDVSISNLAWMSNGTRKKDFSRYNPNLFSGGFMSSSRKKASLVAIKNLYKLILVLNQLKKRVRSYIFILDVAFILFYIREV